jgi:hypothetical protein
MTEYNIYQINYKVKYFMDNIYEVYSSTEEGIFTSYFQGNLSDCEAWIRLREQGKI